MKTEKEKMLSGEYYIANDETLATERKNCKQLLKQLNVDEYVVGDGTAAILRRLIPNAPKSLYIEPPFIAIMAITLPAAKMYILMLIVWCWM